MIEPISGPMYRPVYNGVNIEIHAPQTNMTPPMHGPMMMPPRQENEGVYACPRCRVYDVPRTSFYDKSNEEQEKTRVADKVVIIPQQTVIERTNHVKQDKVAPQPTVKVTNPIKNEKHEPKVESKTDVNKVDKKEEAVAPKKIEVVKPQNLKPVIDINTFIAELNSPDFARQADAMGTIAQVSAVSPDIASHLLDVRVVDTLLGIMTRDTSDLAAPSARQLQVREMILRGHQVSPQDARYASVKAPVERAEENKQYAMYTLASMQKVYGAEVEKMGKVVPLKELPGAKEIIKEVETNPNPHVKVAGIEALSYVQRPEYKADLQAVYQKASQDENPVVRQTAQKAMQIMG